MAMSQCTTFILLNGKEELNVKWDMISGEFELIRTKLPNVKIDSDECSNINRNQFSIRLTDLEPEEWLEFAECVSHAFEKLFNKRDYGEDINKEEALDKYSSATSLFEDDDDYDDEEDEKDI